MRTKGMAIVVFIALEGLVNFQSGRNPGGSGIFYQLEWWDKCPTAVRVCPITEMCLTTDIIHIM